MGIENTKGKWPLILAIGLVVFSAFGFWPDSYEEPNLPKTVDFNYHIRPILSQNCFVCHGNDPSSREANLRLDIEEDAKAALHNGGHPIVEGSVKKSLIIDRIMSTDPKQMMPPPEAKKSLTEREKALLKKWIKQGADWQDQWSLVPPEIPKLPFNSDESKISQAIDYFITEALDERQLTPADKADRNTLIRRVSYILTGLPPTIEELENYLNDQSETAYEKMIEYYLSTDAYGERWARHWLDLVRYGESMGHEGDFNISHAWEYRDYVIRAFNQDVPYDQFIVEHLAGDQIKAPRHNPEYGFNESVIGTGFLFLGDGKHSPVSTRAEEADKIDNMIDVTTKTFQALTVSCARCHDHKFDPIPTADYYSMYGMFESTRLVPKPAKITANRSEKLDQLAELKMGIKNKMANNYMAKLSTITSQQERSLIQNYINDIDGEQSIGLDTSLQLLADFRTGQWDGWYTDGIAFGEGPSEGEIVYNKSTGEIETLAFGFASSRKVLPGIQGVINSPNFTIEKDFIAIRAAGKNATVRVIVDNFHVIQNPLWGQLKAKVDDPEWKTYILDVRLAKGRKAYLEFFSGSFENHVFQIDPNAYVEVQYAVAFSGEHAIREQPLTSLHTQNTDADVDLKAAVIAWESSSASQHQVELVKTLQQEWGDQVLATLPAEDLMSFNKLSADLYDSTHFIGLMEGQAIHSPIFNRGNFDDLSKDKMAHQFLSTIEAGPDSFPQNGSGRLAWAKSLVDVDNPLTSRVMVNRLWHYVFGKGIVETVDNFGLQGKFPTHPDLLDYLAIKFIENGWSIKHLLKQILLSSTFQQSSLATAENKELDPSNDMLHHYPVRRLEAEAIRDGVLATAGCLDRQMYGPPVPVHLTEFMTGRGRPRESGPLDSYGRRSIYRSVRRNFIPPFMQTFDLPIPFSTFGRRNTTNVPAQSLALLNDPFIHEQAEYWAYNLLRSDGLTIEDRIKMVYKSAFSREPDEQDIADAIQFLKLQAQAKGSTLELLKDDQELWKNYCHSIFNLKEFIHLL